MRQRLLGLALVTLCLLSSCGTESPQSTPTPTPPSSETRQSAGVMSAFTATDLDGNEINSAIFSDYGLTMVNIWATFCGPCIDEMPDLGEIHAEYGEKGFQIIGLVADTLNQDGTVDPSQADIAREIVEQTGAHYRHLLPSSDLFGILSQATSVPTTFFVDENGSQVGYAYLGSRSKADWVAIIDPLLAEVGE